MLIFTINENLLTHRFHVVDKLEEGIILGTDFLKACKFTKDV